MPLDAYQTTPNYGYLPRGSQGSGLSDANSGIWDLLGNLGSVFGGYGAASQQGRETQASMQQNQDRLAQQRYGNQLQAAQLNLTAPQVRAAQSVKGDILANAQPFQWTGQTRMVGNIPVPQSTGGLSPALFSDNTRSLGRLLSAGAVGQQGVNDGRAIEAPPELTPLPRAGAGSKASGVIGTLLRLAPLAMSLF